MAERRDRTGQVIGDRFRIEDGIGKGAMADVYRALDLKTSAYVALKILRKHLEHDPQGRQRFEREGAVQARLRHANVAALLGSGVTAEDEPYLAVELLRGKTLRGVIKAEGALAPRRAASYTWQALQGLAAVHESGVMHRDLKPANIMLEPSPGPIERVVLIDFGFASFEGSARLTAQGAIVGSLSYIASERFRGEPSDMRSDLYSMGVILYEMLVGVPPFKAVNQIELIQAHLDQLPPPLPEGVAQALQPIITRALEKQPQARYASALEMAAAVETAAAHLA